MKARLREPEPDGQLAWAGRGAASVFVRAERTCIEGTERPNEPAQLGTAAAEGRERVLAINTGSNPIGKMATRIMSRHARQGSPILLRGPVCRRSVVEMRDAERRTEWRKRKPHLGQTSGNPP